MSETGQNNSIADRLWCISVLVLLLADAECSVGVTDETCDQPTAAAAATVSLNLSCFRRIFTQSG